MITDVLVLAQTLIAIKLLNLDLCLCELFCGEGQTKGAHAWQSTWTMTSDCLVGF